VWGAAGFRVVGGSGGGGVWVVGWGVWLGGGLGVVFSHRKEFVYPSGRRWGGLFDGEVCSFFPVSPPFLSSLRRSSREWYFCGRFHLCLVVFSAYFFLFRSSPVLFFLSFDGGVVSPF